MVRVCTADRLSCAKVVYLVYTAKRLGLDAPFCACFEKNFFFAVSCFPILPSGYAAQSGFSGLMVLSETALFSMHTQNA